MEVEFYSPKTLAKLWDCSRSHIYDLIAEGKLQRSKWGRSVKIHRTEAERYAKEMGECKTDITSASTGAALAPSSTLAESGKTALRLVRAAQRTQNGA